MSFLQKFQPVLWVLIFLQSLVGMVGSLYFQFFGDPVANLAHGQLFVSGNGFEPCELCWFARILWYPIVWISYVAIAKKDKRFTDYILPMTILGIFLDSYHYAIQKLPIQNFFTCSSVNPCNALQINYLGFITIPFLALTGFIVMTVLAGLNTWINLKARRMEDDKNG